ncbi:RIP metalloprotease RseP [Falsiroseomonas oryzae]|uniref:RIP metalloprotease RseP n=1 Tax=Falsiroseomonas oryzae TaxID=2766473 RepID=UPI0022EAC929|nr:RIP metalloprotease RseP [Roseomonas sp. MO-31]
MDFLPDPIRTVLAFVVVLGVLVFIHELGHYLAARWRGVHVERFAVGFGRPLASWEDRRGTQWRIGWIPLGGYVKLHGQETPQDAPPEVQATWRVGETFHDKPVRDRAIVVAAGPIANFALAALLFGLLFATVGEPRTTAGVGTVAENSAAARAGLLPGDRIVALDGNAITRFEEVQRHIQPRAGQTVQVTVLRDGAERTFAAVPDARGSADRPVGVLGVGAGPAEFERLDPFSAIWAGVVQTADVSWQTLAAVGQMITGSRGTEDLGGPLGIGKIAGDAAALGLPSLISFMAVLSVNLALINLFPIPILDGGHLLFYAAEAVRGRPLPPRAQEIGFRAGFALLITLFVFATWNDLTNLGVVRWAAGLFG